MKKIKLFALLLLVLTSKAQAQSSTDTLCRPVAVIKELLIRAKEGDNAKQQVLVLQQRINEKDIQIKAFKGSDSVTVATYERELYLMKQQLTSTQRALRREKTKRFLTGAAGMVSTGIMIYLAVKK